MGSASSRIAPRLDSTVRGHDRSVLPETRLEGSIWREHGCDEGTAQDNDSGRGMGKPEEIAAAAVFLASDESGFVTGVEFAVDDGVAAV